MRHRLPLSDWRPDDPSTSSRIADPEQVAAASGDVEGALVRVPEGAVGGRIHPHGHGLGLQDTALRIPDVNHRARATGIVPRRGHDVSFRIQAHAVDAPLRPSVVFAKLMQYDIAPQ